ncbi:hypothetical protein C8T65DRAFT_738309 [Cerioporus squamosus]|nr:hypothetical protein C8T65DRAFT_738309 [Cerioporus squamosus]
MLHVVLAFAMRVYEYLQSLPSPNFNYYATLAVSTMLRLRGLRFFVPTPHTDGFTERITVSLLPTWTRDVVPGPSTVYPADIMSERMPTPTIQVNSTSSAATVRAGIVGGVVSLIGMGIVFAVVWVIRRHARLRRQVLGLKPSRSSRRISLIPSCMPCADGCPSPVTLPTPYSVYECDTAERIASKLSPSPLVPEEEVDDRPQPPNQPHTPEAASSYIFSSSRPSYISSRLDLPPSYSSLGVGPPSVPRAPQIARSKTTLSVSHHVRMSSRQERPELRITIPTPRDEHASTRRFSAWS